MFEAYCDGACRISNPGLCACGFVVYEDGREYHRGCRVLDGLNTNNVSEYTALLDLLQWAASVNVKGMVIRCDSMLVVNQTNCRWKVKPELMPFRDRAFGLLTRGGHTLLHVKGHSGNAGNEAVDALCNEYLDEFQANEQLGNTSKEQHVV